MTGELCVEEVGDGWGCVLPVGHDGAHASTTLEACICGEHYHCPDGRHYGEDLPCSCTPDCALGDIPPVRADHHRKGDVTYINVLGVTVAILPRHYAFAVERTYTNAWGQVCVTGVLFDLLTGSAHPDKLAWGSSGACVDDILMHAVASLS